MSAGEMLPKVALCLEYPLAERGGVSVLVEELIEGLAADFRLVLVSPDPSAELAQHSASPHLAGHIPFQLSCHPPKKAFTSDARNLAAQLAARDVRLVHFHAGGTFGWGNRWPGSSMPHFCKERGLRVLWTDHLTQFPAAGYAWGGRRPRLSRWLAPLARRGKESQMSAVDLEIAVSEHDRAFVEREFPAGRSKLRRIYHSRLDPSSPQAEAGEAREKLVLAVGHIAYRKGQDVLAKAFLEIAEEFSEWQLVFLGHDSGDGCSRDIARWCQDHPAGGRVKLAGSHPRPVEFMTRASVFVQPSLEEALGLALQEAVFAGCPAVGTLVGGIPEVLDEGKTGFLVPPADALAMAVALRRLMGDPALRGEMSARGRAAILAKGMTRPQMIAAHKDIYRQILSGN